MQRVPYIFDPKLIPRVQKYLEANVDKTYVDIGIMSDELQNTYREYSRRKRNAFRASVKRAYSIVLRSYGLDDNPGSSSDDEIEEAGSENSKDGRPHHGNNTMDDQQTVALYARSSVPKMNENELIDISSDEEAETQILVKTSNGPSTSMKGTRIELPNNSQVNKDSMEITTVMQGKKRKLDNRQTNQMNKKKKISNSEVKLDLPQVTFKDVVGIDNILISISEDLMAWLLSQLNENSLQLGYLLHGPPGCGKTLLAHAIAGQRQLPLILVAAPELVDGISGNSEKMIRDLFKRALSVSPCVLFIDNIDSITSNRLNSQKDMQKRMIAQINSCIDQLRKEPMGKKVILIGATSDPDSMDSSLRCHGRFSNEIKLGIPNEEGRKAILKKHSSHLNLAPNFDWNLIYTPGYMAGDLRNVVAWVEQKAPSRVMMRYKNEIFNRTNEEDKNLITKANSEKDELETNDSEIIVDDDPKDVPKEKTPSANLVLVIEDENSKQEEDIPSTLPAETKSTEIPNTEEVEVKNEISEVCKDEVWTLEDISKMNEIIDAHGLPEHLKNCFTVTVEDFEAALQEIKPLYIREGMVCVPKISWDDVGSLKDLRKELMSTFMGTIKHKKQYKALGLGMPGGVLLCGPPGCGKTLVAKALANEARLNFIAVKGPELMNMYVGESERAVRMCFERAKNSAPCIIFFDEIDALCPKRASNGQSEVSSRVVAQMLTEMDGVNERKEVFILAATNRPDVVDPAILRRGRFDKILYVGLPSAEDRVEILKAITRNETPALGPDVDLESIGKSDKLSGYTGADLAALVKQAALCFVDRCGVDNVDLTLTSEDFEKAISKMTPSVLAKDMVIYEEMKQQYTPRSLNEVNEQMDLS